MYTHMVTELRQHMQMYTKREKERERERERV